MVIFHAAEVWIQMLSHYGCSWSTVCTSLVLSAWLSLKENRFKEFMFQIKSLKCAFYDILRHNQNCYKEYFRKGDLILAIHVSSAIGGL